MDLKPKIVLLSWSHPYDAISMMAQALALGCQSVGFEPTVIDITSRESLKFLPIIQDHTVQYIISLGSPPLNLSVNGNPIWRAMHRHCNFVVIVCDTVVYDYRCVRFRSFVEDSQGDERLRLCSYERNNASALEDISKREVLFHQHPAYETRRVLSTGPVDGLIGDEHERLMFWGSTETELSKLTGDGGILAAISSVNIWGLSEAKIRRISEFLSSDESDWFVAKSVAGCFGASLGSFLSEGYADQVSVIDSAVKRFRRLFLIKELEGLPIDIFGKNWERHLPGDTSIRIKTPIPDKNSSLGKYVSAYRGVVNIDPNWSFGTNERAALALAIGKPLASNSNGVLDGIDCAHQFNLTRNSIVASVTSLLSNRRRFRVNSTHTWESFARFIFQ